ncbi:hypothetical protein J4425_00370 [Candidatus Woesearchaeota archaeon]|nr:hypothetical protein [Candidatus Woesearchaeota archaeon]
MKKKSMIWAVIILSTVVIGIFAINADKASSFENVRNFQGEIKLYKSGSCGCCGVYSSYFRSKGNSETEIISMESIDSIKQEYEIPLELESCHTTIIGDYFIEGHIPLEAVERLMMEKPDIKGIAMPGMPSGSPGMPGTKKSDFIVYQVNNDGSYDEFMRI